MAELIRTDICVIGAGSGGLSVAAGAAQMGARVVLVEGAEMGGDCLNAGCVPSKTLLSAAHLAASRAQGASAGLAPATAEVDYAAVMQHVARSVAAIAPHDSQERFEGLGVRVLRGWARFTAPDAVEADGRRIKARRFVIATGARAVVPPLPGLDQVPYLTNETLWSLREKPRHLIVLGAGPVGIEMAQAHRRLGCEVTVIEAERALAREEPELAALLLARLRAEGIVLHESAPARAVSQSGGVITVEFGAGQTVSGSHLLLALGRRPALGRLNLAAAGIDPARPLVSGPTMRTANRRVYAIGDAAGGQQFTHVAGYQAGVILRALLFGLPAKARTDHVPRAVYTEPELAHVGLTEAEARARHGAALQVVTADLSHNDRTIAGGGADGRIKVMIHRGRPVGAGIVGPQAGELIGLWSLVLAQKLKISAISGTILPYPTLSEVSKRAAGAYFTPRLFENPWVKRVVRLVQRFRR